MLADWLANFVAFLAVLQFNDMAINMRVLAFEIFVWPSLSGLAPGLAHSLWGVWLCSFYGFIAFGVAFDVTLINGLMRRWQRW